MRTFQRMPDPRGLGAALLALALLGCGNAGEKLVFGPRGTGGAQVLVFLDRDGSSGPTASDTVLSGIRVALLVAGTADTVDTATSDNQGLLQFTGVPAGDYQLAVDSATVSDSLQVQSTGSVLPVRATGPAPAGLVRLGYHQVTVREARQLSVGQLVMVTGVVLAAPNTFSDTTAYIEADSVGLRLTDAAAVNFVVAPGDSVRVAGTTALRSGQPVLDHARLYFFSLQGPTPVPGRVTTGMAATAGPGAGLDARLIRVSSALISDTATVTPYFRIRADDGSGNLDVMVDPKLNVATAGFAPGLALTATGVLVPTGSGSWQLRPRSSGDISAQ